MFLLMFLKYCFTYLDKVLISHGCKTQLVNNKGTPNDTLYVCVCDAECICDVAASSPSYAVNSLMELEDAFCLVSCIPLRTILLHHKSS